MEAIQAKIAHWEHEKSLLKPHSISYKVGGPGQHGQVQRDKRGPMPPRLSEVRKRLLKVGLSLSKRKVSIIRDDREAREKKRVKQAKEDPMPAGHISQEIGNEYHIRIVFFYSFF